jgi:hypothetical protein
MQAANAARARHPGRSSIPIVDRHWLRWASASTFFIVVASTDS